MSLTRLEDFDVVKCDLEKGLGLFDLTPFLEPLKLRELRR
jgi:hypothetical protein